MRVVPRILQNVAVSLNFHAALVLQTGCHQATKTKKKHGPNYSETDRDKGGCGIFFSGTKPVRIRSGVVLFFGVQPESVRVSLAKFSHIK